MLTLAELMARHAHAGQVTWIGLRPVRRAAMQVVHSVEVTEDGATGDRSRAGPRAVTLIQAEHLPVIAALLGRDAVDPADLRRNVVVSGLNLLACKGKTLRLGSAQVRLTVPASPCSRMEEVLGFGGYTALRGHGGWCAEVVVPGRITVGDAVTVDSDAP